MKILLSESQLKNIIEAVKLDPEVVKQRFKQYKKIASKYPNPRQLNLDHPNIYAFLRSQGLLDQVFQNRKKYRPYGYWTPETVGQEAQKYSSRKEFQTKNQVAHNKAFEFGMMDSLFPALPKGNKKTITLDVAIKKAKDFDGNRSQFYRKHPQSYNVLKAEGLLDRYFQIGDIGAKRKYDYDSLINDAQQYENIDDLRTNNNELYKTITSLRLMDDVFPDRYEFKINKYIEQGKQYPNLKDLRVNNIGLYNNLKNNDLLDIVFPNRKEEKLKGYVEKAKQYKNSSELLKLNISLYNTLRNNNLLDDVFPDRIKKKLDNYIFRAKQYGTAKELRLNNITLYNNLKNNNLLNSVFPKVIEKPVYRVIKKDNEKSVPTVIEKPTPEVIKKDKVNLGVREQKKLQDHMRHAKIYGSLTSLKKQNMGLYNILKDYGVLDNVFDDTTPGALGI
jgi:hypothetical protein